MLRHVGLAAVVAALLAMTGDSVYARGGMRGRGNFAFGNSAFQRYYNPNAGSQYSSNYRGSSGTTGNSSRQRNWNSSEQSSQTPVQTSTTTRNSTITGGNTSATTSTQQATTSPIVSNTAQSQTQPATTTTTPFTITPSLTIPLATTGLATDPNTSAQRTYGALLHNAKLLIRAGVYGAAATDLKRIITGAPGTRIAAEAQRLLSTLPIT
jgi:hypothetical protein